MRTNMATKKGHFPPSLPPLKKAFHERRFGAKKTVSVGRRTTAKKLN